MYPFRTLFILAVMPLIVIFLVTGCSSKDGDESETVSGATATGTKAPESTDASATDTSVQTQSSAFSIQQQFNFSITLTSPVFNLTDPDRRQKRIPKTHTCIGGTTDKPGEYYARSNLTPTDAQNLSPPLSWIGAPEGTQSFALIMHSTELVASDEPWIHWLLWNIPADVTELTKGVEEMDTLENSARQGLNGGGVVGYIGPCPPNMISTAKGYSASGQTNSKQEIEKYYFEIYALDTKLDLAPGAAIDELLQAIDGHILAGGNLIGERQGKLIMKVLGVN